MRVFALHQMYYISKMDMIVSFGLCVCVSILVIPSSKTEQFEFMFDIAMHLRQNKCTYQFRFYILRSKIYDRFQINEFCAFLIKIEKKNETYLFDQIFRRNSIFFQYAGSALQCVVHIEALILRLFSCC